MSVILAVRAVYEILQKRGLQIGCVNSLQVLIMLRFCKKRAALIIWLLSIYSVRPKFGFGIGNRNKSAFVKWSGKDCLSNIWPNYILLSSLKIFKLSAEQGADTDQ